VLRDTIQPFPMFSEGYVAALKDLRERIRSADGKTTRSAGGSTRHVGGLYGQW